MSVALVLALSFDANVLMSRFLTSYGLFYHAVAERTPLNDPQSYALGDYCSSYTKDPLSYRDSNKEVPNLRPRCPHPRHTQATHGCP